MSEIRIKNVATRLAFPLIDANTYENYNTSAWNNLTSASIEAYSWSDLNSLSAHNITSVPERIGTMWQLPLTQSEMNPRAGADDYILIKLDAVEIESQTLLVQLTPVNINSTIVSINSKTTNLPSDPASNTVVYSRLATSGYTAPGNSDITAIRAKTDLLSFSGSNLNVRVVDKGILNDITVANILAGTVDTRTVEDILEILLAYSSGRITVSGTAYTYYSQNNSSSLFTLTGSTSERTRS